MNDEFPKPGDKVVVDLSGIYIAVCEDCDGMNEEGQTLAVPNLRNGADTCMNVGCGSKNITRIRDLDWDLDVTYPEDE